MKTDFLKCLRHSAQMGLCAVLVAVAMVAVAVPARAVKWSTIFTAQTVRDRLSTPQGREEALQFCRRMHISKVYVEVFRDGYEASPATLRTARDFFAQAGLHVAGAVCTTRLGKPSSQSPIVSCYTNRANRQHLAQIFHDAAGLFNEIIIDDFFFTDCECSECASAKGGMSWPQYRKKLMLQVSREDVLGPALAANNQVKIILKYPQWYDRFQERGYSAAAETALYDRIWVGTELRDPSSQKWGHKRQYEGFFIYRWLTSICGAKTGGAWFDPYGTDPTFYLDQAYVSVLAGAPEILLFNFADLDSPRYEAQAQALAAAEPGLEKLAALVGGWQGIPAYKPPSSEPDSEPYIFDAVGMLGIPLLPESHFPAGARAAFFADYSLSDVNFVPELVRFLAQGGTAFLSEDLAHRLQSDPRLPASATMNLADGSYLKTVPEENGRILIFSDALPKLSYVDASDRVEQLTPALRAALLALRREVEPFAPTSLDAPPRVAVLPMSHGTAVVNFTELPVECHVAGLGGMASRLHEVYRTPGAHLAPDGRALRLPPHGVLMVEP